MASFCCLCIIFILELITEIKGQACLFSSYHLCTGYDWCCPNGYVCTGSSTCLSIGTIVGACIGGLIGLALFVVFIYCVCFKKKTSSPGTVIVTQQAGVVTTNQTGQQQLLQPLVGYSQPPNYGQVNYSYPPPPQNTGQEMYPPPPPQPAMYK